MSEDAPVAPTRRPPRWLLGVCSLAALVGVGWWVAGAAGDAWRDLAEHGVRVDAWLALASAAVYAAALAPMAWFWRRSLRALGQPAPWRRTLAAFYTSQVGKYLPGKGAVVVFRVASMRGLNAQLRVVAAAVFFETLTLMAVGGLLAALLLAVGVGGAPRALALLGGALGLCCLAPTTPPVARRLIDRLASPKHSPEEGHAAGALDTALGRGLTPALVGIGWAAATLSWCLMGASLWLAAWSVGASDASGWRHGPVWLLAATLPVVAGFLSLLPGGVGVREGLTLQCLAAVLGDGGALATALAARMWWVGAEVALCVMLLGAARIRRGRSLVGPVSRSPANHPGPPGPAV